MITSFNYICVLISDLITPLHRDSVPHVPDSTLDLQKNAQNIGNISLLLRSVFPNTSIYPVLGNHDEYPADAYPPAPGSDYYTTILHQAHFDKLLTNDTAAQFTTGQYRFFLSLN